MSGSKPYDRPPSSLTIPQKYSSSGSVHNSDIQQGFWSRVTRYVQKTFPFFSDDNLSENTNLPIENNSKSSNNPKHNISLETNTTTSPPKYNPKHNITLETNINDIDYDDNHTTPIPNPSYNVDSDNTYSNTNMILYKPNSTPKTSYYYNNDNITTPLNRIHSEIKRINTLLSSKEEPIEINERKHSYAPIRVNNSILFNNNEIIKPKKPLSSKKITSNTTRTPVHINTPINTKVKHVGMKLSLPTPTNLETLPIPMIPTGNSNTIRTNNLQYDISSKKVPKINRNTIKTPKTIKNDVNDSNISFPTSSKKHKPYPSNSSSGFGIGDFLDSYNNYSYDNIETSTPAKKVKTNIISTSNNNSKQENEATKTDSLWPEEDWDETEEINNENTPSIFNEKDKTKKIDQPISLFPHLNNDKNNTFLINTPISKNNDVSINNNTLFNIHTANSKLAPSTSNKEVRFSSVISSISEDAKVETKSVHSSTTSTVKSKKQHADDEICPDCGMDYGSVDHSACTDDADDTNNNEAGTNEPQNTNILFPVHSKLPFSFTTSSSLFSNSESTDNKSTKSIFDNDSTKKDKPLFSHISDSKNIFSTGISQFPSFQTTAATSTSNTISTLPIQSSSTSQSQSSTVNKDIGSSSDSSTNKSLFPVLSTTTPLFSTSSSSSLPFSATSSSASLPFSVPSSSNASLPFSATSSSSASLPFSVPSSSSASLPFSATSSSSASLPFSATSSSSSTLSNLAPTQGDSKWQCSTCLTFNMPSQNKCPCCDSVRPNSTAAPNPTFSQPTASSSTSASLPFSNSQPTSTTIPFQSTNTQPFPLFNAGSNSDSSLFPKMPSQPPSSSPPLFQIASSTQTSSNPFSSPATQSTTSLFPTSFPTQSSSAIVPFSAPSSTFSASTSFFPTTSTTNTFPTNSTTNTFPFQSSSGNPFSSSGSNLNVPNQLSLPTTTSNSPSPFPPTSSSQVANFSFQPSTNSTNTSIFGSSNTSNQLSIPNQFQNPNQSFNFNQPQQQQQAMFGNTPAFGGGGGGGGFSIGKKMDKKWKPKKPTSKY